MTAVKMKYEVDSLRRRLNKTQRQVIPRAASSALNRASSKALTQARRGVMREAGVPQKEFKKHFKVFKASPRFLKASIWIGYKAGKQLEDISSQAARKRILKKLNVLSQPFKATMRSGHTSDFVRVSRTNSRKASKGWTLGRPRSSPRNLPIVNLRTMRVFLDPATIKSELAKVRETVIPKEFSKIFRKEVGQRLNRLKRRSR